MKQLQLPSIQTTFHHVQVTIMKIIYLLLTSKVQLNMPCDEYATEVYPFSSSCPFPLPIRKNFPYFNIITKCPPTNSIILSGMLSSHQIMRTTGSYFFSPDIRLDMPSNFFLEWLPLCNSKQTTYFTNDTKCPHTDTNKKASDNSWNYYIIHQLHAKPHMEHYLYQPITVKGICFKCYSSTLISYTRACPLQTLYHLLQWPATISWDHLFYCHITVCWNSIIAIDQYRT